MMRIVSFELPGKSWYRLPLALSRMLGNRSRRGISTVVKANNQLRGRQHVRKEVSCQRRSRQTGKYQAYFSYKVKGFTGSQHTKWYSEGEQVSLLVFQAHPGARLIFGTLVDGPAVLYLL